MSPLRQSRAVSGGGSFGRYLLVRFLLIFPTVFILVTWSSSSWPPPATRSRPRSVVGSRPTSSPDASTRPATTAALDSYVQYLGQVFDGNFGRTRSDDQLVTDALLRYRPATLELALSSLIVASSSASRSDARRLPPRPWPDAGDPHRRDPLLCDPGLLRRAPAQADLRCRSATAPASRPSRCGRRGARSDASTSSPYPPDRRDRLGNAAVIGDVLAHAVLPAIALGFLTAGSSCAWCARTDRHAREDVRRRGAISRRQRVPVGAAPTRTSRRRSRSSRTSACRSPCRSAGRCSPRPPSSGRVWASSSWSTSLAGDFVAVQGIVALLAVIVAWTTSSSTYRGRVIDPRVRY